MSSGALGIATRPSISGPPRVSGRQAKKPVQSSSAQRWAAAGSGDGA